MTAGIAAGSIPEWDLSDRARKALRVAGISVTEMGEYLGVTRETAGRYINGKADMPLQTMRLWAMRTGVPFEWLKTGEAPPSGDGGASAGAPSRARTGDLQIRRPTLHQARPHLWCVA